MFIVIATKNYTFRICAVRFRVAHFIARILSERALLATGNRDQEIAPTKAFSGRMKRRKFFFLYAISFGFPLNPTYGLTTVLEPLLQLQIDAILPLLTAFPCNREPTLNLIFHFDTRLPVNFC